MSYNQKMLAAISGIAVLVTLAVAFVMFDPPYSQNFKVEVAFVVLSQILAGVSLVAKFGKGDSIFPFSLGSLTINVIYMVFALFMALFSDCSTAVFVLWHCVGLAVCVVLGIVFRMGEHHIAEQSKDDPPAQEIKRADVTWR